MTVANRQDAIAIDPVLRLSSLVMVRDAVRAGVGAARLPVSLVSHDLAAEGLSTGAMSTGPRSPSGRSIRRADC